MIRLKKNESDNTQVVNNLIINNSKIIDENGAISDFLGMRENVEFSSDLVLTVDGCKSKFYYYTGSTDILITLPNITIAGLNFEIFTGTNSHNIQCDPTDTISNNGSGGIFGQLEANSIYSFVALTTTEWYVDKKTSNITLIFNEDINNVELLGLNLLSNSVALGIDGQAWTWGTNYIGNLGNNSSINSNVPVQVCGGHTFCHISGGGGTILAIDHLGQAWAWGQNNYGQVGNNIVAAISTPVQVCGGHTFCHVNSGDIHTVAIDHLGQAWAWGYAAHGNLGDNTVASKRTPVQVCGGHTFCHIAASRYATVAIDHLGQAWSWGYGFYGMLGDNTATNKSTPIQVCGGHTFCQISGGYRYFLAIDHLGQAWGWGYNNRGQIGDNTTTSRRTPVQVCGGHTFCQISTGLEHSVAIDHLGQAWSWGYNRYEQLNDGSTAASRRTPVSIVSNYTMVYADYNSTFGVDSDNKIWAWGHNSIEGTLGIGKFEDTCVVTPVRLQQ